MNYLLCKHTVANYAKWKRAFDAEAPAARKAGLHLLHQMREKADSRRVVLLIRIDDLKKAQSYVEAPDADEYMERAGIVGDAEISFLRD